MGASPAQHDADRARALAGYYSEIAKRLGTRAVVRDVLRSAFTKAVVDVGALTDSETLISADNVARIPQPEAFDADAESQIAAVLDLADANADDSGDTGADTSGGQSNPAAEYRRADALLAEQMLSGFEYEVVYGWPMLYQRTEKARTVAPLFLLPVQGEHTSTHLNVSRNGPVRINLPVLLTLIADSDAVAEHRLKQHAEQLATDGALTLRDALALLKDLQLHLDLRLPEDLENRSLEPLRPLPEPHGEQMQLLPSAVLMRVRRGNYFTAADLEVIQEQAEDLLGENAGVSVAQFAFSERPPDRPELTDALAEMHSLVAPDVVFPLPASAPQRQIAVALNHDAQLVAVDGPPGTGKSHTITNLICHLVAQGKSVLVASEKHEALRVVNDKLNSVGTLPFHVSLLGDTPDARRHFRDQIQAINGVASTVSRTAAQTEAQIRARHEQIAEQLAGLDDQLAAAVAADSAAVPAVHALRDLAEHDIWVASELPLADPELIAGWGRDEGMRQLNVIAARPELYAQLKQWRAVHPTVPMQLIEQYAQMRLELGEAAARTRALEHREERLRWFTQHPGLDLDELTSAIRLHSELHAAERDAERQAVPAELISWYASNADAAPDAVIGAQQAGQHLDAHLTQLDPQIAAAVKHLLAAGVDAAQAATSVERMNAWVTAHSGADPVTRRFLRQIAGGRDAAALRAALEQLDTLPAREAQRQQLQATITHAVAEHEQALAQAASREHVAQATIDECDSQLAADASPAGPLAELPAERVVQAAEQCDRALVHLPARPRLSFPVNLTDEQLDAAEAAVSDLHSANALSRRRRDARRMLSLVAPATGQSDTQAAALADVTKFIQWRRAFLSARDTLLAELDGLLHPHAAQSVDPQALRHELSVLKSKLAEERDRRARLAHARQLIVQRKAQAAADISRLAAWREQRQAYMDAHCGRLHEQLRQHDHGISQLHELAEQLGLRDPDPLAPSAAVQTDRGYQALTAAEQAAAAMPSLPPAFAQLPGCEFLAGPQAADLLLGSWPSVTGTVAVAVHALELHQRQIGPAGQPLNDAPVDFTRPDSHTLLHTAHRLVQAQHALRAHPLGHAVTTVPGLTATETPHELTHALRLLAEQARLAQLVGEHEASAAAEELGHLTQTDLFSPAGADTLAALVALDSARAQLTLAPAQIRGTVAKLIEQAETGHAPGVPGWEQALKVAQMRAELEQADRERLVRPNDIAAQARSLSKQLTAAAKDLVDASVQARLSGLRASDARRELQTLSQTVGGRKNKHARLRAFDTLRNEFDWRSLLQVVPVWLLSLEDSSRLTDMEPGLFDVVIIDEASQCTIPQGVPTLLRGKQALVFGDERQLRPVTTGFLNPGTNQELKRRFGVDQLKYHTVLDAKERSLLDMCKARCELPTTLDEHFRCQPPIIDYCRVKFYAGDGNQLGFRIMTDNRPSPLDGPALATVRVDVPEQAGAQGSNRTEADALVRALKEELAKPEWEHVTVGVLSPFRDQVALIQGLLTVHLNPQQIKQHRIVVSTFDGFQGNERDVIFYSLRNTDTHPTQGLSTMSGEKVNVGLSRARYHARTFYSLSPERAGQLREWILYCEDPKAGVPEALADHFDSNFEREVCFALRSEGLKVATQIRSCGYRIDLVVNDGQHQLAVECDGMYWHAKEPGSDELKDSDLYRQDVLERAGWTVFRISDREWAQDPAGCVRAVKRAFAQLKGPDSEPAAAAA